MKKDGGKTPLDYAKEQNSTEIIETLLKAGAKTGAELAESKEKQKCCQKPKPFKP